jgi:hypothetical protein
MPIEENIVVANGKQWGDTTEGGGNSDQISKLNSYQPFSRRSKSV